MSTMRTNTHALDFVGSQRALTELTHVKSGWCFAPAESERASICHECVRSGRRVTAAGARLSCARKSHHHAVLGRSQRPYGAWDGNSISQAHPAGGLRGEPQRGFRDPTAPCTWSNRQQNWAGWSVSHGTGANVARRTHACEAAPVPTAGFVL